MLTGLDDDASITRAYQVGATDFFVKSTQWSLLAGRLHYLLRASRTRIELERSKAKLARAQDLARMGSFDWRRQGVSGMGQLQLSPEGLRVLGFVPADRVSLRNILRRVTAEERPAIKAWLRSGLQHSTPLKKDVRLTLLDGRECVIHMEAEPEFNEHGHAIGYTGIVQDVTAPPRVRAAHPAAGQLRRAHRIAEPAQPGRAHGSRDPACTPAGPFVRLPADRPGPLQGRQRHARPCRRRRVADGSGTPAARVRAPQRPGVRICAGGRRLAHAPHARGGGPARRRRIHCAAARDRRRRGRAARGRAHPRSDARPGDGRRAGVFRHRQRRYRRVSARRPYRRRPAAQLRRGDVFGQGHGQGRFGDLQPAAGRPRAAPSWSWKAHCTRRSSATSWCCTTSPSSTCARRA